MSIFGKRKVDVGFPTRAMSDAEAAEIYDQCLTALEENSKSSSFHIPESKLPPGGYVAIIEAFARYYVFYARSKGESEVLYNHLRQGASWFALAGPDWAIELEDLRGTNWLHDKGVLAAKGFATELLTATCNAQAAYGEATFIRRVEELRATVTV